MNKERIAALVAERYQFGQNFARLLAKLARRLPAGKMRQEVLQNLSEELGQNLEYPGQPHWQGRKALLIALGYDYSRWQRTMLPSAALVIRTFTELITNGDPVVAYAAIAQSESLVPVHYQWLLDQLGIYWPELNGQVLWHLKDHIEHDVDHGSDMFAAAKKEDRKKIARGQEIARQAWKQFWIDLIGSDPAG